MSELWRRLLFLFRRRQFDRDLEYEMRFHLEMSGRRRFGNLALAQEDSRAAWGWMWADDLGRDANYAARSLRRSPGFAIVAALTLALGIGVNTAMFSVLYGTCLAPLPFPEPDRLVDVSMMQTTGRRFDAGTSPANLREWQEQSRSFEGLAPHRQQFFVNLTGAGEAAEIHTWRLSAGALRLLGAPPVLGRWFLPEEDAVGGPRSALLSYSTWQGRFGGNPQVIGRRVWLDGEPFTIVGVMPPQFAFPALMGSWVPAMWLSLNGPAADRNTHVWSIVGRLRPGVSIEQARAEMEGINRTLAKAYPADNGQWPGAKVTSLSDARWVTGFRSTLWLLLGASGLVLLIACANIASLLLARGSAREREFAVRRALGVSRGRLARQLLTESGVLAGVGCVLGIVLAYGSLPVLRTMLEGQPRADEIAIRPVVLAFAAGISAVTGLLFGLVPALRAGSIDPALRAAARNTAPRQGLRKALLTLEVAAGLFLVTSAGLVLETFWQAAHADLGFQAENVLTARVNLPKQKYNSGRRVEAFREELLRRVAALPGVVFAGTNSAPPMGVISQHADFEIEGRTGLPGDKPSAVFQNVSPNYLRAMGIALLRGRHFDAGDRPGADPVAIVSESVARRSFPGGEAIGRRILLDRVNTRGWFSVIGVAADVRENRPWDPPEGAIYALASQLPEAAQGDRAGRLIVLAVRTAGDPLALARAVRGAVTAIDKDQPVSDVMTMRQLVTKTLGGRKLNAVLVALFAGLALALASIGVFGLVSYSVARRTNEIGIRMALGARRWTILTLVARDVVMLGMLGVAMGIAATLAGKRLLASILNDSRPDLTPILAASAAVLLSAMLGATVIAARRAITVDPVEALRHE